MRSLDVGLIFQSFNLIGDMSVYENVEYPLTLRGKSAQERAERVHAALDRVGMTARAKQRPGQLSGGHQQLVAIARAIAGEPPILLADEPTGNLDSKAGDALMAMLSELHAGGATVWRNPTRLHRARERHIYLRWESRAHCCRYVMEGSEDGSQNEQRRKRRNGKKTKFSFRFLRASVSPFWDPYLRDS